MRHRRTNTDEGGTPPAGRPPAVVAVEVVMLWPRDVGGAAVTFGEAGLWPVFVMVVDDSREPPAPAAKPLFDLLDRPKQAGELTVLTGGCRWSIVDPRTALLWCDVQAANPVPFDVRIMLPAERVLGILDVVARGDATIGITGRRHAWRLTGRVDVRAALRDVVLLSCAPSSELATIGRTLLSARHHGSPGR